MSHFTLNLTHLSPHRVGEVGPPSHMGDRVRGEPSPGWKETRTHFSRLLREQQTDAEKKLWQILRSRQLSGYKFRRQRAIGPYIVDFCCLGKRLVVELDGGQHAEKETKDKLRTDELTRMGFRVLRFWNNEVLQNTNGVAEVIEAQLLIRPPHPFPSPTSKGEREVT